MIKLENRVFYYSDPLFFSFDLVGLLEQVLFSILDFVIEHNDTLRNNLFQLLIVLFENRPNTNLSKQDHFD